MWGKCSDCTVQASIPQQIPVHSSGFSLKYPKILDRNTSLTFSAKLYHRELLYRGAPRNPTQPALFTIPRYYRPK